jgi:hypothetical protein
MSGGRVSNVSVSTADTTTSNSSSQEAFGRGWDELTQDATDTGTSRVIAAGPDANRLSDLATGMFLCFKSIIFF